MKENLYKARASLAWRIFLAGLSQDNRNFIEKGMKHMALAAKELNPEC